ncbi:RDD family protein [Sphingobacterium bambusae]|uniref:RDD family protein n=1 Tax=Sphingobacterium bambusae TaxID=662858 RepID=A0ABW6BN88_9SPHI|nr:RDD family protein [Sphingobacterium bambusae]WPL48120.1 RDD family protein [Sphingobacterium bambusae]
MEAQDSHKELPPTPIFDVPNQVSEENYPGVFIRVKALVVDGFFLLVLMFILSSVFSAFQHVPDSVRLLSFVFVFFLYDPLFTSLFAGTVGHMAMGIRVKREDAERNINFPSAVVRFVIKAALGWISLITVSSSGMAIHDRVIGSRVVNYKKN